jgi:hypothetical protein
MQYRVKPGFPRSSGKPLSRADLVVRRDLVGRLFQIYFHLRSLSSPDTIQTGFLSRLRTGASAWFAIKKSGSPIEPKVARYQPLIVAPDLKITAAWLRWASVIG